MNKRWAIGWIACLSWRLEAVEPLKGPEVGIALLQQTTQSAQVNSNLTKTNHSYARQRRLDVDIPIPVALWIAMPFANLHYLDRAGDADFNFQSDQRYGVGLLHHAAEGDPAWRFEINRTGALYESPGAWTRFIFNLAKRIPALKLRPSDQTLSWIGINAISANQQNTLWIPEIAWSRTGPDGLTIDLLAPQRLFIGYRGPVLGVLAGAEQMLRNWSPKESSAYSLPKKHIKIERQAKLKALYSLRDPSDTEFLISASIFKYLTDSDIDNSANSVTHSTSALGAEISVQWIPNP